MKWKNVCKCRTAILFTAIMLLSVFVVMPLPVSANPNQIWVSDSGWMQKGSFGATAIRNLGSHDINVSTKYAPETNGIKIKYDGTEIPASESLTIGNTYCIYYKIVNKGDYNETVAVTVKITNSTWTQTIATHTWSIKMGKYHYAPGGGESWDTSGLAPGNYNLTVNASIPIDDDWSNNERIRTVTLVLPPNQPPVSDPNGPYTSTEGVPITFDGSGSYDPDGIIVSYAWDFGDGDTGTGVSPTHTYAEAEIYTVTLTITDDDAFTDTTTTTAEAEIDTWAEINEELDALIEKVNSIDIANIIKHRLVDKLEYAKTLVGNARIAHETGNIEAATKKLGVAKNQVESFASMVKITRRISPADKASFLADATAIITMIDELIGDIETVP